MSGMWKCESSWKNILYYYLNFSYHSAVVFHDPRDLPGPLSANGRRQGRDSCQIIVAQRGIALC